MSWSRRHWIECGLALAVCPRVGLADPRPPPESGSAPGSGPAGGAAAGAGGVAATPLAIHDRYLPHDAERQALTQDYLVAHLPPGHPHPPSRVHMVPRAVALHWTGGRSADSAWHTFAPARLAGRPELQGAGALNVGAHFLVDRSGRVERLADETRILRHVIGLNHCTVGVENVGDGPLGGDSAAPLTAAQVRANVLLVAHLRRLHPTIGRVFGHHEYRRLEGGPLFAERDPAYRTAKRDPGDRFMAAVRAGLAEGGLAFPPVD